MEARKPSEKRAEHVRIEMRENAEGVISYCSCGWNSGNQPNSMQAAFAFVDHKNSHRPKSYQAVSYPLGACKRQFAVIDQDQKCISRHATMALAGKSCRQTKPRSRSPAMTDQARIDGKAVLRGKDAQCPVCHTDNLCFDGLRLGSTGVPCEGCGTLMDVVDQEYDTYFGALIPVYGVEICPKNDANFGQNEASHDH